MKTSNDYKKQWKSEGRCVNCGDYNLATTTRCFECNEAQLARSKKFRDKRKKIVFEHFGNRCVCCGETNPLFLTIDHINNNGNIERKKNKMYNYNNFYTWIIQHNFPDDLQVLCWNCNMGKAINKGICPHKGVVS
jgi:hypothetical protein